MTQPGTPGGEFDPRTEAALNELRRRLDRGRRPAAPQPEPAPDVQHQEAWEPAPQPVPAAPRGRTLAWPDEDLSEQLGFDAPPAASVRPQPPAPPRTAPAPRSRPAASQQERREIHHDFPQPRPQPAPAAEQTAAPVGQPTEQDPGPEPRDQAEAPARRPRLPAVRRPGFLRRPHGPDKLTASRPARPVRHRDPQVTGPLTAEAIAGHLVITPDRVIGYYRIPLLPWTFRSRAERLAVVQAAAMQIARLSGRRCHLRVTSRPVEPVAWAMSFDAAVRGRRGPDGTWPRPAMPGPCPAHPHLSEDGCPTCRPDSTWGDFLRQQQRRLLQQNLAERDVYLGVEITARGPAQRLLGQWGRAADAERASLARQAEAVTAAVEGAGIGGRPCTPGELQWLMIRSASIGLPGVLPVTQDPRPAPFSAPAAGDVATGDVFDGWAEDYQWSAEPFAQSVQVRRAADGATAHACVLTVADMSGVQDLDSDSPWIQRTDRLGYPVEWSLTFDVLDPHLVGRAMNRQADKIRAQYSHITADHGQDAPPSLDRQMAAVRRIQEEAENSDGPGASYVYAWARMAVTAPTAEEARRRASQVTELYSPAITVRQPPGQYSLLREFVPGEPLASSANRRFMHAELLAGGGAAAGVRAGQPHGYLLGATTRTARRPVFWDPWYLMEKANRSGLVTVTGSPGGGKSGLAGLIAYLLTRSGVPTTILDPSGMLDRLCRIPALSGHAAAVNLLTSPPGTLCPYGLVPDPRLGDYRFDAGGRRVPEHDAQRAYADACRAAEAQRRALVEDVLKMILPPRSLAEQGAEDAIGEAVRRAPATAVSSPRDVIDQLRALAEYGLENRGPLLANRLENLSGHPLARLFFPRADEVPDEIAAGRRLLTVMTLRGITLPDQARRPEDWSNEERLSVPVLHLAAQLLRRMLLDLPRQSRKAALMDETHVLLRDATGVQTLNDLARDSRKGNTLAVLISQNPQDLLEAGVANLVGTGFAGRTEGDAELAATCGLLGLPAGQGYEALIAGLAGTGEVMFRDGLGGLEQLQIDLGADPDLLAALTTTPGDPRETTR